MALNLKPRTETNNTQATETEPVYVPPMHHRAPAGDGDDIKPQITVTPLSSREIMDGDAPREFILLAGKDSVGKSCAIVSLAWYVENVLNPEAKFFVIDSENKFRTALRSFGADAPKNIVYYKVDDMNQVTWVTDQVMRQHRPGDWLACESMSRIWERAQDLGYMTVSGYMKAEYMEARAAMAGKKAPVTPSPDQLWSVTKGAHDVAFLDRLTQCDTLNVILTTTISRPPKDNAFMKESAERKALRLEVGIDSGIEGAPRLPYYVESLLLLELKNGKVTCRVLRDNLSANDETRGEFPVSDKKSWATEFYSNCR
jgi:hypothetical protein